MSTLLRPLRNRPALWLRRILLTNAGFSAFCAALFLTLTDPVAGWTGFAAADVANLGIELGVFAAIVAWVGTRDFGRGWARALAALVAAGDSLWVVGSLALAAGVPAGLVELTTAGRVAVLVQAMVVADFAVLQFFRWWQLRRTTEAARRPHEARRFAA